MFGKDIAKAGTGRPITQNITKFSPEDKKIVLFDSRGLEAGMHFEDFLHDTLNYFENNEKDLEAPSKRLRKKQTEGEGLNALEAKLHLVWYVVNAASARFQDFEEKLCRELFYKLPIIFVLNKSDACTSEQLENLRKVIENMELPNCVGIAETVTSKHAQATPVAKCPQCESDELIITTKLKMAICENCGAQTPFKVPNGLERVVQ